jgi:DNA repair photolyase
MEPRAATPERRLDAVRQLSAAGVPTIVMFAPVIPGLNDHELEAVLERSAEAGAVGAGYVVLRLPLEIKDLFREWLEAERPDRAKRVMSLVRQMRGGRDYDPDGARARLAKVLLRTSSRAGSSWASERYGLNQRWAPLDVSQFRVPPRAGDQLALF